MGRGKGGLGPRGRPVGFGWVEMRFEPRMLRHAAQGRCSRISAQHRARMLTFAEILQKNRRAGAWRAATLRRPRHVRGARG